MLDCNYLVVGGGQTGLLAAQELARLDKRVVLVDQEEFGGSYIFTHDLPKKLLLEESVQFQNALRICKDNPDTFGFLKKYRAKVGAQIQQQVKKNHQAVISTLKSHPNLKLLNGRGEFTSKSLLEINSTTERHLVSFEQCVLAVGKNVMSKPKIPGISKVPFLHQHSIFQFQEVPTRLGIIGLTPESLEVAEIYSNFGVKVDIFEAHAAKTALKELDRTAFNFIVKNLLNKQVDFHFSVEVDKVESRVGNKIGIYYGDQSVYVSHVYVDVEEVFNGDSLQLQKIGLVWSKKGVVTSKEGQTQLKYIHAFGECSNKCDYSNKFSTLFEYAVTQKRQKSSNSFLSPVIKWGLNSDSQFPYFQNTVYRFEGEYPLVAIGLSETQLVAHFGPEAQVEVLDSLDMSGFVKIMYRLKTQQVAGIVLAGDYVAKLESLAMKFLQDDESYISLRNYIKGLLAV